VVWVHRIDRPAVVLGSTQHEEIVDADACRAHGVEVVRRRSGGGLVLLVPDATVWVDTVVPRHLFGDDLHAPMRWLGRIIATTLENSVRIGSPDRPIEVSSMMRPTHWSPLVCFEGLGPGEVTLAGRKLTGVSQGRTRDAIRLQCCWYLRYDPDHLRRLIAPPDRPGPGRLGDVATVSAEVATAMVDGVIGGARGLIGGEMGEDG
jgi:lipoate-protein ligase A